MKKLMIGLMAACVCAPLFALEKEESEILVVRYDAEVKPSTLALTVTDSERKPLEGVEITTYTADQKKVAVVKTNEKGEANIPYPEPGKLLRLDVAKAGYVGVDYIFRDVSSFVLKLEKE